MSEKPTFTPGPWIIREHTVGHPPRRSWIEINAPVDGGRMEHPICRIPTGFTNQDADARLISAATDLLAACQKLVDAADCQSMNQVYDATELARAAIAKVKGGPP